MPLFSAEGRAFEKDDIPFISASGEKYTWRDLWGEVEKDTHHAEKRTKDRFEASGHHDIGQKAYKRFVALLGGETKEDYDAVVDSGKLRLSETVALEPGRIIALAGDFFGLPNEPIYAGLTPAERRKRFKKAYDSLKTADAVELEQLQAIMQEELDVIAKAEELGLRIDYALAEGADDRDRAFMKALCHSHVPYSYYLHSRYSQLALQNYDHFGAQAKLATRAGYEEALTTLRDTLLTLGKEDHEQRREALATALGQMLFACHFLTDLFASGHIRTPRLALQAHAKRVASTTSWLLRGALAGQLARDMHDEENKAGVHVEAVISIDPVTGEPQTGRWKALGDKMSFTPEAEPNIKRAINAVAYLLRQVNKVFQEPDSWEILDESQPYEYESFIPEPKETRAPLFKVKDGCEDVVLRRQKEKSDKPGEYDYVEDWWPTVTAAAGWWKHKDKPLTREEAKELEDALNELSDKHEDGRCTIL